jgi:hypothetical protein
MARRGAHAEGQPVPVELERRHPQPPVLVPARGAQGGAHVEPRERLAGARVDELHAPVLAARRQEHVHGVDAQDVDPLGGACGDGRAEAAFVEVEAVELGA